MIIYLFILGTHFVCWFLNLGGRYAFLAFILSFTLIINFVLDFLKENPIKKYYIITKLRIYILIIYF